MSQQDSAKATALQRPTNDDKEAWRAYWDAHGNIWRTEPEIDLERQAYLNQRRAIKPDIEQGIYPFKDIKLSRADVEWLLATKEKAEFMYGHPRGLDLRGADLRHVDFSRLPLGQLRGGMSSTDWRRGTEEQREKAAIHLEGASLNKALLTGAVLRSAHLEGADLKYAHLEIATLRGAHLVGDSSLFPPADLRYVTFDYATVLENTIMGNRKYGFVKLADVNWGNVNLGVVDWSQMNMLGDEQEARQTKAVDAYRAAVRANRQLAAVLRDQGLNEEADRFAYRAQALQREVWRRQHKYLKYAGSWLLWLLAGHGYRPFRGILWYLAIVIGFALTYYTLGHLSLWPPDAFVYSLTSFHGRGFFPGFEGKPSLHDPLIIFAAFEAVIGLFIEICFIATFTQRFFGR